MQLFSFFIEKGGVAAKCRTGAIRIWRGYRPAGRMGSGRADRCKEQTAHTTAHIIYITADGKDLLWKRKNLPISIFVTAFVLESKKEWTSGVLRLSDDANAGKF